MVMGQVLMIVFGLETVSDAIIAEKLHISLDLPKLLETDFFRIIFSPTGSKVGDFG